LLSSGGLGIVDRRPRYQRWIARGIGRIGTFARAAGVQRRVAPHANPGSEPAATPELQNWPCSADAPMLALIQPIGEMPAPDTRYEPNAVEVLSEYPVQQVIW